MSMTVSKKFYHYEKEEQWLNEMAAAGNRLVAYKRSSYTFEPCQPGEYCYRIEFLQHRPKSPEARAYIGFMEEAGVRCICTFSRWAYFERRAEDGPFDVYSDLRSKERHYSRIARFFCIQAVVFLLLGLAACLPLYFDLLPENGPAGFISGFFNGFFTGIFFFGGFLGLVIGIPSLVKARRLKRELLLHE